MHKSENQNSYFHGSDSNSSSETETNPRIVDLSEEYDPDNGCNNFSDIRKNNTRLLSEQSYKYRGEIGSRENFHSDDNCVPNALYSDVEFQYGGTDSSLENIGACDTNKKKTGKGISILPNISSKFEKEKAVCVQNQLTIWENLLEARIHSQKILNKANNLPYPKEYQRLLSDNEEARETKQNLEALLQKLMETKIALCTQFSDIRKLRQNVPVKKAPYSNSKEYDLIIKSNFEKFKPYRNAVLVKWEDRTKLLTSWNARKRGGPLEKLNVVKNIESHLLMLKDLVTLTRTIKACKKFPKRQPNTVENMSTQQEASHVEIFDDTDFYHSQLRELIEYKTNASSNSYELNTQFSELQKLRQKMKKNVDTRASKGRKIRYVIHNKLINFMGSRSSPNWSEESKSELYKSLFHT